MKQNNNLITAFLLSFAFIACAYSYKNNENFDDTTKSGVLTYEKLTKDSLSIIDKNKLYTQAITDYLKTVYQKDKTQFDSLFIGTPEEYSTISLPSTINNTKLFLLKPGTETENKKTIFSKSAPYINLIGWINSKKTEFVFVTFYPGFQHQFDFFVEYKNNPKQKTFELKDSRIETYFFTKENKLERVAIYKNGKYMGDKKFE